MSDNASPAAGDADLLSSVGQATTAAGDRLLAEFSPQGRPSGRADMATVGRHTEDLVLAELRPELARLRPAGGGGTRDVDARGQAGPDRGPPAGGRPHLHRRPRRWRAPQRSATARVG